MEVQVDSNIQKRLFVRIMATHAEERRNMGRSSSSNIKSKRVP